MVRSTLSYRTGPFSTSWLKLTLPIRQAPCGVCVDDLGNCLVADTRNHRLQLVDRNNMFAGAVKVGSGSWQFYRRLIIGQFNRTITESLWPNFRWTSRWPGPQGCVWTGAGARSGSAISWDRMSSDTSSEACRGVPPVMSSQVLLSFGYPSWEVYVRN